MDQTTFKALFEHSSMGIIISNDKGDIERANPFAAKIFGYRPEELNGQKIEVLIPPPICEKHIGYREQYLKNPQPRTMGSNLNLMAVKKNGEAFPVEVSLTFFEVDGLRQIVSFVNDITERKKAEQDLIRMTEELESKVQERTKELSDALLELSHTNEGLNQEMEQRKKVESQIRSMLEREKELNELKTRFVSMASHEFRTPLGGILTSTSLIAKYPKSEDEPKREKHINNIKKSVKNLTNILNDFLSIDKLDQGMVGSSLIHFDVPHFINELIQEMVDTSDNMKKVEIDHQSAEIKVFQEKEMFRNVIINLMSNAFKYSPASSPISVRTGLVSETELYVEIQDHGIGIPLPEQKHLFERFFRAQNVTNLQGTGLGLNIVKRYLDLMAGRVEFTSKENIGTTFRIFLPLERK